MTNTKNEILKELRKKLVQQNIGDIPKQGQNYSIILSTESAPKLVEWLSSKLQEVERTSLDKAADIVAQTLPEYTERSTLLMTEPDRMLAKEHNNKRKGLLAQLKGEYHE